MAALLDTNVIIRFLTGDDEKLFAKSVAIFRKIERGETEAVILDTVLMEVLFVLTKLYGFPKSEVVRDLKALLTLPGVVNADKVVLAEALTIHEEKNLDFVDALICAKSRLQGYGFLSFDEKLKKRCK